MFRFLHSTEGFGSISGKQPSCCELKFFYGFHVASAACYQLLMWPELKYSTGQYTQETESIIKMIKSKPLVTACSERMWLSMDSALKLILWRSWEWQLCLIWVIAKLSLFALVRNRVMVMQCILFSSSTNLWTGEGCKLDFFLGFKVVKAVESFLKCVY